MNVLYVGIDQVTLIQQQNALFDIYLCQNQCDHMVRNEQCNFKPETEVINKF